MRRLLVGIFVLLGFSLQAQQIEGRVLDALSGSPLPGATIKISDEAGTVTDENGYYTLEGLTPGRYQLEVSFVGYVSGLLEDVWVKNGKVTRSDVSLQRDMLELNQIIVKSENPMIQPGRRTLNEEQINRFAAAYNDPARLMVTSPDLAITNDQNNEVSVRGLSPNYNVWRVEGVEVANPNHLQNAGTLADQPAGTSGGVNVLSAQVLDQSSFEYGAMSNGLNNSVAGIYDMYLREGVRSDYQYTAQASLIGLDFSAEGPLGKKRNASFIANYRYSFTGILAGMGVDFGGESISYQDLSFNVSLPFKNGGNMKVFGVGGSSYNRFTHKIFEESEEAKDRKDINYDGKMGLTGFSLSSGGFKATVAISGFMNDREEILYDSLDAEIDEIFVERNKTVIASDLSYNWRIWNGTMKLGATHNLYSYTGIDDQFLGQYYISTNQYISQDMMLQVGATASLSADDFAIDPRVSLSYFASEQSTLTASAGIYSQQLNPYNYYHATSRPGDHYFEGDTYNFISSNRFNLDYSHILKYVNLDFGLFFYQFPEINYLNLVASTRKAHTFGGSMTVSKNFESDWYALAGVTVFDSQIQNLGNSPYNSRYNLSASGGKEFAKVKNGFDKAFTINARVTWQGGMFYNEPGGLNLTDTFEDKLGDYFRIDLRAQWTKSKPKLTRIWAIDLQNVMSRENEAFVYFDPFLQSRQVSTQLGLIPVLTYRLEF